MNKKLVIYSIATMLILPLASAGLFDWISPTGKVTSQPVDLSINVGGGNPPTAITYNESMTDVSNGLNEGPLTTSITIKFEANDVEGVGNLNDSSAYVSFTKSGEQTRTSSCTPTAETTASSKNYTCTIDMYWWDSPGTWSITSHIEDLNGNIYEDLSKTFTVGATMGFTAAPTSLTWNEINPGATNIQANEYITLNNTGNVARNIQINSTHLLGLTDNTKALFAENFAIDTSAGCAGTTMNHFAFTQIVGANLPRGDYTLNDGTGQEDLYYCLQSAGQDLTAQSYSTAEEGPWTMKITA